MKNKGLVIGILILICIGSLIYVNPNQIITKTILRLSGDYSTPDYETSSSILSKAKEENVYYNRLYRLKSLRAFKDFQERKISSIPFVQIYNKSKKLMLIASGNECKWALLNFFNKKDTSNLVAGDSMMYKFVMDRLEPIDLKTNIDTFDSYIIAGWANFIPKLSQRLFNQTNDLMMAAKDKICLSYINLDYQKEWKDEEDSLRHISKK